MSPRAACRLEQLGYEVYDYALGKNDWLAWGLDHEGEADLVGAHTVEVPTCRTDTRVQEVRQAIERSALGSVVVVGDGGIVLGKLGSDQLDGAPSDAAAGDLMHEGPTTVRPATELEGMRHRMEHAGVDHVLVTRSDGCLFGALPASA